MGKRRWKVRYNAAGIAVIGKGRTRRRPAASSLWKRRARALVYLLLAALTFGGAWVGLDDRFYIRREGVEVRGTVRVSPDEVFQAAGLDGLHILWARSGRIERRLLASLPTLERAEVSCHLPAWCVVTVTERQPRMLWDEEGRWWWIDADGLLFSLAPEEQGVAAAGWTVQGPLPRDEDGRLAEPVRVALNGLWEAGQGVVTWTLSYAPEEGLSFVEERGWRVVLGEGPGMAERVATLARLNAFFASQAVTPTVVSVRFPDAPFYSE